MRKSRIFRWQRIFLSSALILILPLAFLHAVHVHASEEEAQVLPEDQVISETPFWYSQLGDYFVADVKNDIGYLMHSNGTSYQFPIVTGRPWWVYYLGRYYFAATPVKTWEVTGIETKYDRIIFGDTGVFMRLNDTPYGIHGYAYFQDTVARGETKISYGCILVPEQVLLMLQEIYANNGDSLKVETFEGPDF